MGCLNLSLDAKHDMWAYFVLYSVKGKYWNDFVLKVFGFVFGKMKVLEWLPRKWDFGLYAYNFVKWEVWTCPLMRNMICEPIWFCIRYNGSIGMTLSRKWDFGLYAYKFDKWEIWTCPLMRKNDMWTYLVLNSEKWKYWNDPCCENEI